MHQVNDAIVHGGKVVVTNVPFSDGQRVQVTISEVVPQANRLPIGEVRTQLKGHAELLDDPSEPMIPEADWETPK